MKDAKDNDNLIKRAYLVMMAKTLLRSGSINSATFSKIMAKIESVTS